jgi:hypothetical protein
MLKSGLPVTLIAIPASVIYIALKSDNSTNLAVNASYALGAFLHFYHFT